MSYLKLKKKIHPIPLRDWMCGRDSADIYRTAAIKNAGYRVYKIVLDQIVMDHILFTDTGIGCYE